jgi:predicted CoA-binding protein
VVSDPIDAFLADGPFAVLGASRDRAKYGNKVLRAYLQNRLPVFVVHPRESEIEGVACVPRLADLPQRVNSISLVTPPQVTERLVEEAGAAGVRRVWMQPGAESDRAVERAEELGLQVIAGGACILVALRFRDR